MGAASRAPEAGQEAHRHQKLVQALHALLTGADLPEPLLAMLHTALTAKGKLLATPPGSRWPDLVLDCCLAAGGDWQAAIPAALAAELMGLALDVLDEVEDDDPSPLREQYGTPLTLNCTTALLGLAHLAVSQLASYGVPAEQIVRCLGIMASTITTATGGQHLDLSAESGPALSQGEIEDLVARKSGALVGGCCALGAAVAGAPEPVLELYRAFGRHVGVAAQLDNDMHDLWESVSATGAEGKSDLRRGKQTVPLAFLRDAQAEREPADTPALAESLWDSGALPYAWTRVQVHREEARDLLARIDAAQGGGRATSLLGGLTVSSAHPSEPAAGDRAGESDQ